MLAETYAADYASYQDCWIIEQFFCLLSLKRDQPEEPFGFICSINLDKYLANLKSRSIKNVH